MLSEEVLKESAPGISQDFTPEMIASIAICKDNQLNIRTGTKVDQAKEEWTVLLSPGM